MSQRHGLAKKIFDGRAEYHACLEEVGGPGEPLTQKQYGFGRVPIRQ